MVKKALLLVNTLQYNFVTKNIKCFRFKSNSSCSVYLILCCQDFQHLIVHVYKCEIFKCFSQGCSARFAIRELCIF